MLLDEMIKKKLIHPTSFLPRNLCYLIMGGSHAYATNRLDSDIDIAGFAIPPKATLFPHSAGYIVGFGSQPQKFEQFTSSQIVDPASHKQYDFNIYNVVKFFELARQGNPNIIEMLFVPDSCVLYSTQIGQLVRENRKDFLSKLCFKKFKSYAFSELHKMQDKKPEGKRKERAEKFGYDVKFAQNLIRLLLEVEQIMLCGSFATDENAELLKDVGRGNWSQEQVRRFFNDKEASLEQSYAQSSLPNEPDEEKLKQLLLKCLQIHYGNITETIVEDNTYVKTLRSIVAAIDKLNI